MRVGLRRVACLLSFLLFSVGAVSTANAESSVQASWQWADQGLPSGVTAVERVGTVSVLTGRGVGTQPHAFVRGSDGNLWLNWWTGSSWSWSNHGAPNGGVVGTVGVVLVWHGLWEIDLPHVFVRGGDGNLWLRMWNGSTWSWSNQGSPSGGINAGVGVTKVGERPYAFARGTDGNLWLNWWTGSSWSWSNQGTPSSGISAGIGVTKVNDRPYAFVRGGDGNLWLNWWTGRAWSWSNQGTPGGGIAAEVGVIAVSERPYAFVRGADGNLWVHWWSGRAWAWSNQGAPNGGVVGGVGAMTVKDTPSSQPRPYAFVRAGDGNLWLNWWTGSSWIWSNQGSASGGIADGIGVTTVKNDSSSSERPYAFVRTNTGSLAVNWWE